LSLQEVLNLSFGNKEKEAICIVHRRTGGYGKNNTDHIDLNRKCYCDTFPPCHIFFDEEEYALGDEVLTPLTLSSPGHTEILTRDPKHFGKLLAVVKAWTAQNFSCDIILYSDLDVVFTNFNLDLREFFKSREVQLVFSRQPISGVNAGVYALRTTDYVAKFLEEWWTKGTLRNQYPHGDQGALYDVLLKRATSLKPGLHYNGSCYADAKYQSHWGKQTGCFNEWMLKLGHIYPNWDNAWRGEHSGIKMTRNPKLQGFPYEKYGNRPAENYRKVHYEPFNYAHVHDECTEPQDLMVHKPSFSLERTQGFNCFQGGWNASEIYAQIPGGKVVYSADVRKINYGSKNLSRNGQAWLNQEDNSKSNNLILNIPKSWKLPPMKGLPGFVGVGCGHCGSTSLYTVLMQHPLLVPGFKKELLYLSDHLPNRTSAGYASSFPNVSDWQMTGEFSPYYLGNPSTPELLRQISPNSKVILMLRNPLEQCRSAHGYDLVLQAMLEEPTCSFYKVLYPTNSTSIRKVWNYRPCDTANHYSKAVLRWQKYTAPENLLLVDSAEFKMHPDEVLLKIQTFLGLPEFEGFRESYGWAGNMHKSELQEEQVDENLPQAKCFEPFKRELDEILMPYRISNFTF